MNSMNLSAPEFRFNALGVLVALVIIDTLFFSLSSDFMSLSTWASILSSAADLGIVVLGVTFLMMAGEFDLSVGANFALSGISFAFLITHQVNSVLALGCALLIGASIGFINGIITLTLKIPSFIITLSTMLICRGFVLLVTDGFPISIEDNNAVMNILAGSIDQGLLTSFIWWFIIGLYLSYTLNRTKIGNHIQATGLNKYISHSQGINTRSIKLMGFILCGVLSALAGVVQFSHLNTLSPTAGEQYELYAIAAAVIGGASLNGGSGSIIGAILGTILMNSVDAGLVQAGVSTYWYRTFVGVILISAVAINFHLQNVMFHKNKS